jgi:hypothetical protein
MLFFQCIDFPSFLPPLVTVGRLGSDSGGLWVDSLSCCYGEGDARRDGTTRHQVSHLQP